MSDETSVVSAERLRDFGQRVLTAAGMPADDAAISTDAMLWAELRGLPWLGITRLDLLVRRIEAGGTRAVADLQTGGDTSGLAVIDGRDAWGMLVGARAMLLAIEKARQGGIGAVVVRNTTTAGAMGYSPMLAVRERMIGLAITNGQPLQAPTGGSEALIGNQAHAIGCPAGRNPPLLFDAATSVVTWARIHGYVQRGEPLPPNVALDATGQPTVDPAEALAGTLLPLGGHRGYGLALLFEVLTGILAGGTRFGPDVGGPLDDAGTPMGVSLFMLAIDPAVSMPYEAFTERVDMLIDRMHAAPRAPGVERIYVPGERGFLLAQARERDGIPLSPEQVRTLTAAGESVGVNW